METTDMRELKNIQGKIKGINWWFNEVKYRGDKKQRDITN